MILVSSMMVMYFGNDPFKEVPKELRLILLLRGFSGAMAFITVTKALEFLPLTIFQVITQIAPFSYAILAYVWLGEKLVLF